MIRYATIALREIDEILDYIAEDNAAAARGIAGGIGLDRRRNRGARLRQLAKLTRHLAKRIGQEKLPAM